LNQIRSWNTLIQRFQDLICTLWFKFFW